MWQHEHEALRLMTAARRAGSFGWEAIVEHCIALVAKSPLILLGHGYNLLQVTVGERSSRVSRSETDGSTKSISEGPAMGAPVCSNRDSPDDSRSGVNVRVFMAFLQGSHELSAATSTVWQPER